MGRAILVWNHCDKCEAIIERFRFKRCHANFWKLPWKLKICEIVNSKNFAPKWRSNLSSMILLSLLYFLFAWPFGLYSIDFLFHTHLLVTSFLFALIASQLRCFRARVHCFGCLFIFFSANPVSCYANPVSWCVASPPVCLIKPQHNGRSTETEVRGESWEAEGCCELIRLTLWVRSS